MIQTAFLSTEQSHLDHSVPNETQGCSWNTTVKLLLKSMASLFLSPQPQFQTIWWTNTLGNPNYCFHLCMPRNGFSTDWLHNSSGTKLQLTSMQLPKRILLYIPEDVCNIFLQSLRRNLYNYSKRKTACNIS